MAWDSSATMQMTSQYQGMYAQQMGFSQQLSSYGQSSPYGGNTLQANNMMLGGMRGVGHAANIGMAAAGVGAGLGVAAMGGGMLASTGVGIPIMAAGAAMGYAGSQMYKGAEQQGVLNQQLRGSFGFRNQQGGHGFSGADMTQIGGSIREMSNQVGSGGEMTSFRELGNIASKMGQMGFAQGVKDVATFSKKFKEMTDSLKTMAKDLGTTMEGAMEFAQAAKGSGIFGMSNAAKFGSIARNTAVSGGLAMSEVTAMAGIGSQISRSVGGLGKAGAMAGMKTIGQIGTATQMGVLSEEDIYNTTGLTGAEGRQAYAASSLQKTATFLSSGRGRRTLASMAGKDGKLDMNAVDSLMSGNMGTTETMASAQSHLGEVGRANFIRNEGRLRGEAMSKIGGFLPGIQMMQWAKSKGVDIQNMDDRSMLFAQRQLGMGRDEVDQAIKMAQEMPRIVAQQNADASGDKIAQRIAEKRKTQGMEGIKNRFAQAEHAIDSKLEKIGQDIFNEGSNKIEAFMNKLAGVYVESQTADMAKLDQDIRHGGKSEAAARKRTMGQGPGGIGATAASGTGGFAAFSKGSGTMGESITAEGGFAKFLLEGESNMSKLKKQGYDLSYIKNIKDPKEREAEFTKRAKEIESINAGSDKANAAVMRASTGDGGKWLKEAYSTSGNMAAIEAGGEGEMRMFQNELTKAAEKGDPKAAAVLKEWEKAGKDKGKQASIIQSAKAAQEITVGGLKGNIDEPGLKQGKYNSAAERNEAYGKALGASGGPTKFEKGLGHGLANIIPFGGLMFGDTVTNMVSGGKAAKRNEQGALIADPKYQGMINDLFGGKPDYTAINNALTDKDTTKAQKEQFSQLKDLAKYNADKSSGASAGELEKQAKAMGLTTEQVEGRIKDTVKMGQDSNAANVEARQKLLKETGKDNQARMRSHGLIDGGGELRKFTKTESDKMGAAGAAYLQAMVDTDTLHAGGQEVYGQADKSKEAMGKMSASEARKVASLVGGTREAADLGQYAAIDDKLKRGQGRARGGTGGNIAQALGLKLTKDELKDMKGMSQLDMSNMLGNKMNLGDDARGAEGRDAIDRAAGLLSKKGATKEDRQQAAAELQRAKGISDAVKSEEAKKGKDAADKDTPMYQVLNDIKGELVKSLGTINTHTSNTANNTWGIDNKTKGETSK